MWVAELYETNEELVEALDKAAEEVEAVDDAEESVVVMLTNDSAVFKYLDGLEEVVSEFLDAEDDAEE